MLRCLAGALGALFAIHPALADERPTRYDMEGHCSRLANGIDGFSPDILRQCMSEQGDALDAVKRIWTATPDYIQRDCSERGRAGHDEDYILLQKCIHDALNQVKPDEAARGR